MGILMGTLAFSIEWVNQQSTERDDFPTLEFQRYL